MIMQTIIMIIMMTTMPILTTGCDNDYDNEDIRVSRSFVSSKSVDSSLISLDDTLQSQKEEVHEKI